MEKQIRRRRSPSIVPFGMPPVVCCAIVAAWAASAPVSGLAAQEIRGDAKVISGNEMKVGRRAVRLFGIRAPGLGEVCRVRSVKMRCGIVAWAELIKLADGQYVSCDLEKTEPQTVAAGSEAPERKSELFATCYLGETDLNEALVRSGWAKAAAGQTDRYQVDETDARESRRGLWASDRKPRRRKSRK